MSLILVQSMKHPSMTEKLLTWTESINLKYIGICKTVGMNRVGSI